MNVVVPVCFASDRWPRAMYWTFHVLRLSKKNVLVPLRFACNVLDVSYVANNTHKYCSSIVLCIPKVALRNVLDVSCVATIKHECRNSNVFCIA